MANVISSINTKLYKTAIASANEIGNVSDITGPGFSRDVIDTTNHSTANSFKENIVTRWDGNEVSFQIFWDPQDTNHQHFTNQLTTSAAGDSPDTYVLRYPSNTGATQFGSLAFSGHVTSFSTAFPVEGAVTAAVTLRVSGEPTINDNDTTTP